MDQESSLLEEIKKSGFLLECKAAQVLQSCGYNVEQNLLLHTFIPAEGYPIRLTEVDVFASESRIGNPGEALIIECKGSSSDDKLILIPAQGQTYCLPSVYFDSGTVLLDGKRNIMCDNTLNNLSYFCHTGDFFSFKSNDKTFIKASKQNENSNLYRGIRQLYFAIDGIFNRYSDRSMKVFPVIVTNAEIQVAIFDFEGPDQTVRTRVVPWAAHQNSMIYDREASKIGRNE